MVKTQQDCPSENENYSLHVAEVSRTTSAVLSKILDKLCEPYRRYSVTSSGSGGL